MLKRMHATKLRKRKHQELVDKAQQESKAKKRHPRARVQKVEVNSMAVSSMEHLANHVDNISDPEGPSMDGDSSSSEGLDPYIQVQLGTNLLSHDVLVDLGATTNSMVEDLFGCLTGVQLIPSHVTLVGFNRSRELI